MLPAIYAASGVISSYEIARNESPFNTSSASDRPGEISANVTGQIDKCPSKAAFSKRLCQPSYPGSCFWIHHSTDESMAVFTESEGVR